MDLSSKSIESFKQDLIKQINKYRNNHGSKKLMNDPKIDKISQQFASKLAKSGKLDYSSNEYKGQPLGESVYKSENYFAPLKLAKALYDEISEYDFKSKDPEPNNFTQMVWKDSELIGFGMAKNSEGKYFYVINYFPTGNIDGEFKKNVLPLGTKVALDLNSKQNKKEEISKNESLPSIEQYFILNNKFQLVDSDRNLWHMKKCRKFQEFKDKNKSIYKSSEDILKAFVDTYENKSDDEGEEEENKNNINNNEPKKNNNKEKEENKSSASPKYSKSPLSKDEASLSLSDNSI